MKSHVSFRVKQEYQNKKGTSTDTRNPSCSSGWTKYVLFHTGMDCQHSHHQFLHFN